MNWRQPRKLQLIVIIIAMGVLGFSLTIFLRAQTPTASSEAEDGTLSAQAKLLTDSTASGSGAIKFTAPTTTAGSAAVYTAACNGNLSADQTGSTPSVLNETSGIAASRTQSNVYWTHNDSGSTPQFFAINAAGKLLATFNMTFSDSVGAKDYEDIAIGPGPTAGKDYIYIAATGDNTRSKAFVSVYRIAEPTGTLSGTKSVHADRIDLKYPGGAENSEAFMIDPRDGNWYILEKTGSDPAHVHTIAGKNLADNSVNTLTKLSVTLNYPWDSPAYEPITAADIAPDAGAIVVKGRGEHIYKISGTIAQSLQSTACLGPHVAQKQGEAAGWAADNKSYFLTSDGGSGLPIYQISL